MRPFDPLKVTEQPPLYCYSDALQHCTQQKVSQLNPGNLLNEIKLCLSNNLPVVIGVLVYTSFESDNVARTGYIPMPDQKNEQLRGGHALTVIGFDDAKSCVIIQNSWSTVWGEQGYGYIPYDFISDFNLTFDCHAFTDILINKTPTPIPVPVPIPAPIPQPNPWNNPPFPPFPQPPFPQPGPNPWNNPPQPPWPWNFFYPPFPQPRPMPRPRPRPRQRQRRNSINSY